MIHKHQSRSLSQAWAVLLLFALVALAPGWAIASEDDVAKRRTQLQQALEKAAAAFERSQGAKSREQSQLSALQKRLGALHREQQALAKSKQALDATLRRIADELAGLQEQSQAQVNELQRLSLIHSNGRRRLAGIKTDAARVRAQAWLQSVGQQRVELLGKIESAKTRQEALRAEQLEAREALAEQQAKLQQQRSKLKAVEQEHRSILRALESELRKSANRRRDLSAELESLDELLSELRRVKADSGRKGLGAVKGKLNWPLRGRLLRRYGQQKAGANPSRGVLIAAAEGTKVAAIHDGVVAWVGWLPQRGLLVIVDHGQEYFSLYAHAQSVLHGVGDTVLAGRPLLQVGRTGGLNEAAMYFELRKGRTPLNPNAWFHNAPR